MGNVINWANQKEVEVGELTYQLKSFGEWRELTEYQITEKFQNANQKLKTYKLFNLCIDIEDGVAYCDDAEGFLKENDICILNAFLVPSIKRIRKVWIKESNTYNVCIEFKTGIIEIEALID